MDKNAIKKFAVWARRELIARVSQRAAWYGITEKDPIDDEVTVVHGKVLTDSEQGQRRALIAHIRKEGYQQVMEEVAYTWFNRFIALRFMEVNGYLPSYTRVFCDDSGAFNPQILKDAIHLDLSGLDMEKVYALEEADDTEALFKYLIITQCNDLNRMLPGMFQKIADYTELLFPDFLLREGSVAHQMVTTIPEDDWKDAVQIIGWLYQYYNAEPKDEVFAALKKNIKISKEKIPAATQLFTPDWIVRYMVENSLGRLWMEGHPNDELKAGWKYYLEKAPQKPEVEQQLAKIRSEYAQIDPASILCSDPCMGSGHILVYMFDVLMQIYLSYGYTTNEAVESIVRNNLWGMDIDDRAAQLAYFAVMMKAQQYDRRWLAKQVQHPVQPNVFALQDSGDWCAFEQQMRQAFAHHPSLFADPAIKTAKSLFDAFVDAKEFGSIIQPKITLDELTMLENVLDEMTQKADLMDFVAQADANTLLETLKPLILQARGLAQKYHAVVTNPPYMGNKNLSAKMAACLKKMNVTDMYQAFMIRTNMMLNQNAQLSIITKNDWLKKTKSEGFRRNIYSNNIEIIADMGPHAFESLGGEIVGFCILIYQYSSITAAGKYIDSSKVADKEQALIEAEYSIINNDIFESIPRFTVYPGMKEHDVATFASSEIMEKIALPRSGMTTGDSDRFIHNWYEVSQLKMQAKWFPVNVGGTPIKWYGNNWTVIDWENNGYEVSHFPGCTMANMQYQQHKGITWGKITSGHLCVRFSDGAFFTASGLMAFPEDEFLIYVMSIMNSNVSDYFLDYFRSGLDILSGDIANIPVKVSTSKMATVNQIGNMCIELSREDWDSFEVSRDFQNHPLVQLSHGLWDATAIAARMQELYNKLPNTRCPLETCYLLWQGICNQRFSQLKANEEELNRIFIDIYGLNNELTPEVADKDVTIRKADLGRDIRSLISYAVGCMMGRYSLDKPGLVLAGQKFTDVYAHNPEGYQYGDLTTLRGDYLIQDADKKDYLKCSFGPDRDGILPITDDEYFDDDIVGMFVNWIRTVFGADSLEDNLKYIADALGGKGSPRDVIRQYFLNDFYKDHLRVYQKRPIYWLFDSGKNNSFKCLIYMHRYQPDTIARIRTDYVHETQARYRTAIETLERESSSASTGERVKLQKRISSLKSQAEELRVYEEKVHHLADQMIPIDLDDGVKVNYAKFADVLAPIK